MHRRIGRYSPRLAARPLHEALQTGSQPGQVYRRRAPAAIGVGAALTLLQPLLPRAATGRLPAEARRGRQRRGDDGALHLADGGLTLRAGGCLKPVVLCAVEVRGETLGYGEELVLDHTVAIISVGAGDHEPARES